MITKNKDISNLSNFNTPAKTKYFYEFMWNIEELIQVLKKFKNEKKLFISWWTNILFAFDTFDWITIKFSNYNIDENYIFENYPSVFDKTISSKFKLKDNILEISWFEKISDTAEILYKENLSKKWERFIGLPWTIAGAIVWNAWCFWLEIQHHFLKAQVMDLTDFKIKIINKQQANFSYRNSIFKNKNYIILKAWFDLSLNEEKYSFNWTLEDIVEFRTQKQPQWFTCGSFFKNPSKEHPAWKLIEQAQLKWYKIWWAYFSEKHANFLMSDWTASWKDLINLKNLAQTIVENKFNIKLIPEVNIVYN